MLALAAATTATPARAYLTSLNQPHFGTSLGGAYAGQISAWVGNGWNLVKATVPAGSTYQSGSGYVIPARFGFYYRDPNFTLETYLRYFTSFGSTWTIEGGTDGSGTTRFKGVGGGLDFDMPMLAGDQLRAGLVLNAEYLSGRVVHSFESSGGAAQKLHASSSHALFGAGIFGEAYIGDLWALALRALYVYDLGGTWSATQSGTFLGTSYTASGDILDSEGNPLKSNFSHWRVEAIFRLAFY
jgi:hypothetical protein